MEFEDIEHQNIEPDSDHFESEKESHKEEVRNKILS